MELAEEKGSSSWLSALPIEEHGFCLHKGAFTDALALRYGWQPPRLQQAVHKATVSPQNMQCPGQMVDSRPSVITKHPYTTLSVNRFAVTRSVTANLLTGCLLTGCLLTGCKDVCVEPDLQPLPGEHTENATVLVEDGARLDTAANGFWCGSYERYYFDVHVFNPHACPL